MFARTLTFRYIPFFKKKKKEPQRLCLSEGLDECACLSLSGWDPGELTTFTEPFLEAALGFS